MTRNIALKNGLIISGSGSPGYYGTILIKDNKISILRGNQKYSKPDFEIDCTGKIISPGFIDLHSHSSLTIFGEPTHEPKVFQGVTTELVGIDGVSPVPFKTKTELERYIWLDSGFNDYPPEVDWLKTVEYLNKIDNKVSVNIACMIGNGPLRIWGVCWNNIKATKNQIQNMCSVLRECMEEGAWGLSTGLDYPPGAYADTEELINLSKEAYKLDGFYHTHTRAKLITDNNILAPWDEAIEIGEKSGIPVHLTHYKQRDPGIGSYNDYLGLVENAREDGMDVTFDCYTYPYSGTTITILLPDWSKDGGPEALMNNLKSSISRKKMCQEINHNAFKENWLTNFKNKHNKILEGLSVSEIALFKDKDPCETLFDLLIDENLGISTVGLGNTAHSIPEFVKHPAGMIASDSLIFGDYPNPRTYGNFTKVISEFSRDDKILPIEDAIRKMTSFPAQRLGLSKKGLLLDGYDADIVVLNLAEVKAPATKNNPKLLSEGIEQVIVNGEFVIKNGVHTGNLPGKAIRRGINS